MQTIDITLPCGAVAEVQAFDGHAQLAMKNAIADVVTQDGQKTGEKTVTKGTWEDKVLARVLLKLDGKVKASDGSTVTGLRLGSRRRVMIAARRLAYGDAVKCRVPCVKCQTMNEVPVDLAKVDDVAYPESKQYTITVVNPVDEVPYTFNLKWATGVEEQALQHGLRTRTLSFDDDVLTCIQGVTYDTGNGDSYSGQLARRALLERIPVAVLDELRVAYSYTVPILRADGDAPVVPDEYAAVPACGARARVQATCEACGENFRFMVTEQPDFIFRGLLKS